MNNQALQALVFDVDGTLADTERDGHRPAFNMAFAEAGLDWNWSAELYGQLLAVTGGKERIRYYLGSPELIAAAQAVKHMYKRGKVVEGTVEGTEKVVKGVGGVLKDAGTGVGKMMDWKKDDADAGTDTQEEEEDDFDMDF